MTSYSKLLLGLYEGRSRVTVDIIQSLIEWLYAAACKNLRWTLLHLRVLLDVPIDPALVHQEPRRSIPGSSNSIRQAEVTQGLCVANLNIFSSFFSLPQIFSLDPDYGQPSKPPPNIIGVDNSLNC